MKRMGELAGRVRNAGMLKVAVNNNFDKVNVTDLV